MIADDLHISTNTQLPNTNGAYLIFLEKVIIPHPRIDMEIGNKQKHELSNTNKHANIILNNNVTIDEKNTSNLSNVDIAHKPLYPERIPQTEVSNKNVDRNLPRENSTTNIRKFDQLVQNNRFKSQSGAVEILVNCSDHKKIKYTELPLGTNANSDTCGFKLQSFFEDQYY